LKVTVLGSGTSQGVPVIGCPCEVCASADIRDKRLRSSILVEKGNTTIVVDTGPDFRQQMLQHHVTKLDAVLITHCHKDHIAGMDDLRSYNYLQQQPMDIYARPEDQEAIKHEFYYAFRENPYPGVPRFNLIELNTKPVQIGDIWIVPFEVMHMHLSVLGFRFDDFSYITDVNYISTKSLEVIRGSKIIVLDALRKKKHLSHFNLNEAIEVIRELKPEKAYFTHISHLMGTHAAVEAELPAQMFLAYDGLQLTI
jgi:phosphoribosyl 1,2-cyclic phosphate phosphodiesterase